MYRYHKGKDEKHTVPHLFVLTLEILYVILSQYCMLANTMLLQIAILYVMLKLFFPLGFASLITFYELNFLDVLEFSFT